MVLFTEAGLKHFLQTLYPITKRPPMWSLKSNTGFDTIRIWRFCRLTDTVFFIRNCPSKNTTFRKPALLPFSGKAPPNPAAQWRRTAQSKETNGLGASFPEDGSRTDFRNVVFFDGRSQNTGDCDSQSLQTSTRKVRQLA